MTAQRGLVPALILVVALAGCGSSPAATGLTASTKPSAVPVPSIMSSPPAAGFPTSLFAGLGGKHISDALSAELQGVLEAAGSGHGLTAALIAPQGIWSGATGMATTQRAMVPNDQMSIASVTKSIVAAQVVQLVEAGELALDDVAAEYLPNLEFDVNGATIRQLLGHRSGLPGYDPALFDLALQESPSTDRKRVWTPAEMLALVLDDRDPAGEAFEYNSINYLLLGLVIEHVRGLPIAEVLRDGVLDTDGVERLIYQPDEAPTEPMAMPFGASTENLEEGGGYLPSLAAATSDGPSAAMASDAASLARWWRAFCAGEIVSENSLTEMTAMHDGYGLGLYEPDPPGTVGHGGSHIGYTSLAGCLPGDGVVVVVLSNDTVVDLSEVAQRLLETARSE